MNSLAGNFTYNYVGNSDLLNQIDLPNGAKSTFTYDALERLTQLQSLTSGDVNIAKFTYALDNRDIRTSMEKTYGTDPLRHVDYGYDTVNQLTSAVSTESPPAVNQTWAYDPMGNRTQHESTFDTAPTSTATYANNSLNQITGISTVKDGNTTESTFAYDANGNTTQVASDNSTTQYTYDDADRLSSVVYKNDQGVNVSKSTYAYDGLDRLRIITRYTWSTGASEWTQQSQKKFVYDGMQAIQERNGDDNVTATNIWDGNIGGLEARVVYDVETPANPPQKYFYHYDGSGNVTAVTDETQQTVAQYEYDAYGNLINSNGAYALQNPWRFSTKYYDDGSGLYYYGYRFYSPGLGKWISRDPIAENGGLNLYGFVGGDPINAIDSYGLNYWDKFKKWVNGQLFGKPRKPVTSDEPGADTWALAKEVGGGHSRSVRVGAKLTEAGMRAYGEAATYAMGGAIAGTIGGGTRLACKIVGTGLKGATPAFTSLFRQGTVRSQSIIFIRSVLTKGGFVMRKARGKGYLFRNGLGEEVRIMSRNGGWDVRIRNKYGNYLDEFGNVADPSYTHRIDVSSK